MTPLSGKQRRWLRGLGHSLTPHVQIAEFPVSENVMREIERQIEHHELIKIKIGVDERDERHAGVAELAVQLKAHLVQELGKTALLYKHNPEHKEPLRLPKA